MKKAANNNPIRVLLALAVIVQLAACSTTSGVPEGELLYAGIDKVRFENYERNEHSDITQEEVLAALDCPPNGSLFGSSYYRSPIQLRPARLGKPPYSLAMSNHRSGPPWRSPHSTYMAIFRGR